MATINYKGPAELTDGNGMFVCLTDYALGDTHIFDLEFELLDGTNGRSIAVGLNAKSVVSMTETALFDLGFSVNAADVYDVIYIDINLNCADPTDSYKSVIIGTTASG